jgi:hypothetical protein
MSGFEVEEIRGARMTSHGEDRGSPILRISQATAGNRTFILAPTFCSAGTITMSRLREGLPQRNMYSSR